MCKPFRKKIHAKIEIKRDKNALIREDNMGIPNLKGEKILPENV